MESHFGSNPMVEFDSKIPQKFRLPYCAGPKSSLTELSINLRLERLASDAIMDGFKQLLWLFLATRGSTLSLTQQQRPCMQWGESNFILCKVWKAATFLLSHGSLEKKQLLTGSMKLSDGIIRDRPVKLYWRHINILFGNFLETSGSYATQVTVLRNSIQTLLLFSSKSNLK